MMAREGKRRPGAPLAGRPAGRARRSRPGLPMKTVVVFQGGGALGAFSAGAWQVLAEKDDFGGPALTALAGTSIGAVNAAVVAHAHAAPDRDSGALLALWRER